MNTLATIEFLGVRKAGTKTSARGWRSGVVALALGLVAGLVAVATPATAAPLDSSLTWTQLSAATSPPAGLGESSLAYDGLHNQLVLFGGYNQDTGTYSNDTWTWDGTTWTLQQPTTTSPPVASLTAMAYDVNSQQLILLDSGQDGGPSTTWSWDGANWNQLDPSSAPPGLVEASMAYDSATNQLVLFGGITPNGTFSTDTWTWGGQTWTLQTPTTTPPPGRAVGTMDIDASGEVVLFGGSSAYGNGYGGAEGFLNDTWTWDGSNWMEQSPSTPPPARTNASMAYDPDLSDIVLTGGDFYNGTFTYYDDTWTWDGTNWTEQSTLAGPPANINASMAYDSGTDQLVMVGGYATGDNETWVLGPAPAATVPGAPINVSASPGQDSSTVSWTAPSDDGGSAITGYDVYEGTTPGGEDYSSPACAAAATDTSCRVSGTAGTTYYFTVEAVNAVGNSTASDEASATPAHMTMTLSGAPNPSSVGARVFLSAKVAGLTAGVGGSLQVNARLPMLRVAGANPDQLKVLEEKALQSERLQLEKDGCLEAKGRSVGSLMCRMTFSYPGSYSFIAGFSSQGIELEAATTESVTASCLQQYPGSAGDKPGWGVQAPETPSCTINGDASVEAGTLTIEAPPTLTWTTALTGYDQILPMQLPMTVINPIGDLQGSWNVTAQSSAFAGTNSADAPALAFNGSGSSSASTDSPVFTCAAWSSCSAPDNLVTYPVPIDSGGSYPPVELYNNDAANAAGPGGSTFPTPNYNGVTGNSGYPAGNPGAGMGDIVVNYGTVWLNLPADTVAGTYNFSLTLDANTGP